MNNIPDKKGVLQDRKGELKKKYYVVNDNAVIFLSNMGKFPRSKLVDKLFFLHFAASVIFIFNVNSIRAQIRTDSVIYSNDLINRHFKKIPVPPGIKMDFDNILISRFGGIWAKSKTTGLAYFDGTEMKVYRHAKADSNSLSSDMIFSIAEDQKGNLYAATWDGGLNIIDKSSGHITKIVFRDSIAEYKVAALMSLCFDEQQNLFIGLFGRGFLIYNTSSGAIKHFNLDAGKPGNWFLGLGNSVALMRQDPIEKNITWMLTNTAQLYSFDRNTLQVQKHFGAGTLYPGKNMAIMRGNVFFGAGPNRAYNKSTKQLKTLNRFKDWGYVTFYTKSEDELYCYYNPFEVITYNINSESFTSYKLPSFGLSGMSTVTLFLNDGKENIWMIADGELYYSSAQYSLFSNFNIFDKTVLSKVAAGGANIISDIKWDPVNKCYYLFYTNWVYLLNEKFELVRTIDLLDLPPQVRAISHPILVDNSARLWILTDTLHVWDKTKQQALPYPQYFGRDFPAIKGNIISFATGRRDTLFFYTDQQNLYSFQTNSSHIALLGNLKNKENEFPTFINGYDSISDRISLYAISGYSSVFDLASRKLYDLNTPEFRIRYQADGGTGCFDSDGNFWIKGVNPVLYKFDRQMKIMDSLTTFDKILPDNNTGVNIKLVGKDSLMISDGNECYLFHTKKRTFTLINADNGAFRMRQAGIYYFINRSIFYSTSMLLQYARLDKFTDVAGKPQVYLTEMKLGNKRFEMNVAGNPHFKYDQNNLSFVMSAVEMNFPERIQYSYRLVNFNNDWTFTDHYNRNIVYTNLPPGKFTLQIRARTLGQEWEEVKSFTFIITPPFWQTWWFRVLAGLFLISMAFFFIRWRVSLVRKKEQLKTLHEKELLELEARALRAQMNPHFIFNSLNSIKSLINKNENEKAANYLTTFSKLIRTLFHNSDKREVSLFEEIETCKLYAQLERMRFGDKIEFIFNVDESIDLKDIKVPALILQPLIENAIWHGLVPKESGGTIAFSVKEINGAVECMIDDDGIGRELSNQYKAQYRATHESKGIGMTQSRLELDKLLNEREDTIQLIDKENGDGVPSGTKVIITFKEK